jgi:hypothetical protein
VEKALAVELANGTVSEDDVSLGVSVIAGNLRRHPSLGLLDASLSLLNDGPGWRGRVRALTGEQRWRLRSAATWLASKVNLSKSDCKKLNLIYNDIQDTEAPCCLSPLQPFASVNDPDTLRSNMLVAEEALKLETPSVQSQPLLYMVWDATYLRRGSVLLPKGCGYQGKPGLAGCKWTTAETSACFTPLDVVPSLVDAFTSGGAAPPHLLRAHMATQALDVLLKRADCKAQAAYTVCWLPVGQEGDKVDMANLFGKHLQCALDARLWLGGCGYDNATSHSLLDGCILGVPSDVCLAREKNTVLWCFVLCRFENTTLSIPTCYD